MLYVVSKINSLIPDVRTFLCKLYSKSAAKPSQALGSKKPGGGLIKKAKPEKKFEGKSKPFKKKFTKCKMPTMDKKSGSCKGSSSGSEGNNKSGGSKKPPTKPKQQSDSSHFMDKCDVFDEHKGNSKPFRLISYCMLPLIAGFSGYVLTQTKEEKEAHHFVPYEYMFKRLKRFAWGDGHTTFFHGPNNFMPEKEQYEKKPNSWDTNMELRKALREQHAKEELERRKMRHDREGKVKAATDEMKDNSREDHKEEKVEETNGKH